MNKLDDLINKQVGREIGSCEIDIEDIKTFADALVETIKDTIRKEYFVDKEGLVDFDVIDLAYSALKKEGGE